MTRGHKLKSKKLRVRSKELIAEGVKLCTFCSRLYALCFIFSALCPMLCVLLFSLPSLLQATVTGNCNNCHTMHNSQGGQPMAYDFDGSTFSMTGTPKEKLLIYSCLGCHSSTVPNESIREIGGNKIPIVFNTVGYPSNPLAGGNFFSVKTDDTKGHNIFTQDVYLSEAPGDTGFSSCGTNSCHANLYGIVSNAGQGLDGRQGCEKCHLDAKHHAKDHEPSVGGLVTNADQGWYRFLSGHFSGEDEGVEGFEDSDWEKTCDSNDHNEYLGFQTAGGNGFIDLGHTTTAYCTGCHGDFHVDQGSASPWLRHPSDATLPVSGEYANYTLYNCIVPVARLSLPTDPSPTVTPGTDMVMCLSCHRAHASPFFKMVRWDYKNTNLSTALEGCNVCHTSKN
jgi:hypothetical protein